MTPTERMPVAAPTGYDPSDPQGVQSLAEAEQLLLGFVDIMDALLAIVEQETQLVRTGRREAAAHLQTTKSNLAREYVASIATLQASGSYLTRALPDALTALRHRHDTFRALLQINLTVLAVESAVSDGARRRESVPPGRTAIPARDYTARRRLPDARNWPGSLPAPQSRPSISDAATSTRRHLP